MTATTIPGSPVLENRVDRLTKSIISLNYRLASLHSMRELLTAGTFAISVKIVNRESFAVAGEIDVFHAYELDPFLPLIRTLILCRQESFSALRLERQQDLQGVQRQLDAMRIPRSVGIG